MKDEPGSSDEAEDEEDPIVEECIRDALGPYLDILSPEEVADHRRFLVAFITTHPAAVPLYDRLRKRSTARVRSGSAPLDGSAAEEEPEAEDDGTFGRQR